MSGLFRRNRRTRAAAAEESRVDPPAPSEPQDASTTAPGGYSLLADPATPPPEPPTEVEPAPEQPLAAMHDLPAGLEVEELHSPRHSTERRSRLRRRTRYLRRVRELLLRDLGGLVYEISRVPGGETPHHKELVHAKTQRLAALDAELFALEDLLGDGHPETVLREPGVGGICPTCGELHSSDARFCSACGSPLTGHAAAAPEGEAPAEAPTVIEPGAADRPTEVSASAEPGGPAEADRPADADRPASVSGSQESPQSEEVTASGESPRPAEVSGSEESPRTDEVTASGESPRPDATTGWEASPQPDEPSGSDEPRPLNGRGADGETNGRNADGESAGAEWSWPVERPR